MLLSTLSIVPLFSASVFARAHGILKRQSGQNGQDGPVDAGTAADCTYYDTALNNNYNCAYFENEWGVSHEDFVSYNPAVKEDCSGIKVGNSYCIEVNNGQPRPSSTIASGGNTPTAAPAPSPTQDGLIGSCTKFYFAKKGDNCDKIVANLGGTVSTSEFITWNPAVGDDCSGLWANTYYCIAIPGTPTAVPTTAVSTSKPSTATAPSPTQDGLISTCTNFYKTVKGDYCGKIVDAYGTFTIDQFTQWNPAVGEDCSGLWANTYYCVGVPGTPTVRPTSSAPATTTLAGPSPTQDGIVSTCSRYHKAVSGDTCAKIQTQYGIFSLTQFLNWNPAVGTDCSGLWLGYYYCIGLPSTPTTKPTTTTKAPNPTPTGPSPTQDGIIPTCQRFHLAVSGDTCAKIQTKYATFSLTQFLGWNPAVGSDCSGLWLGYYYCIGVPGTPTVKPTTSTAKPTTTTAAAPTGCTAAAPTPTQPGAICACKKWHQVASGNTCAAIQTRYSISAANFNRWNPQVGADCSSLWLGYNVCVSA